MKAILTIGVSASGKSTWASKYVEEKKQQNEQWLVINQDEIRLSLIKEVKGNLIDEATELKKWDYHPTGESENNVKERWNSLVTNALSHNYDGIIISDTNLDGGVGKIDKLINFGIAQENIATQYFPISFEEAFLRDKNRKFSVGETVLTMQFEKLHTFLEANQNTTIKKPKM